METQRDLGHLRTRSFAAVLSMTADFDLRALYAALDEQRRSRDLTWAEAAREINRFQTTGHPIAASTITALKDRAVVEGDGVLQMLRWLGRTPESFIPGFTDAHAERFRLRVLSGDQTLRWDAQALHTALDAARKTRALTWEQVGREVGGFTPGMLTNLANGGRVGFPGVMRIVQWLGQPAATFTRAANR